MTNEERVHDLLRENASIWANLGTKSKLDLGTTEAAEARWKEILKEIYHLDRATWDMIAIDKEEDSEWESPSFIKTDTLLEANKKIETMDTPNLACSIDDEECWSCGA